MNISVPRALARVAMSNVARHRHRSLLVVLLIALPVAAMTAGIVLYRTSTPTQDRIDVSRFGRADLLAAEASMTDLRAELPGGSVIEPLWQEDGRIALPGAKPGIQVLAAHLDGLAEGMLTLVDGRAPTGVSEVAITEPLAELAGVGIGGTVTIDGAPPMMVVGLVENPLDLGGQTAVLDPSLRALDGETPGTWLVGLPPGADPEAIVASVTDPTTGAMRLFIESRAARISIAGSGESTSILILGTLALVEAALIASAAFAVSIRRRQRELGLLAAIGATPRQLAGTVIAEAAVLGLAGCVAGIAIGILGSIALTPWLDELTDHRNPPLMIDGAALLASAAIGFVAALVAAIVPARTAAGAPVLLSLSGRRPAPTPARRTLWFGLIAVGVSLAMTLAGANLRIDDSGMIASLLMVGGAVLGTLGFGACGPWLLERLEGVAVRLPLASRMAFRDTARARSRSSPIVTAILASVAATVALGAFTVSRDAENLADWRPWLYPDQVVVIGEGGEDVAEQLQAEPGVLGVTQMLPVGPADGATTFLYVVPGARDAAGEPINMLDRSSCGHCDPGAFEPYQISSVSAATPAVLEVVRAEAAAAPLREGHAVLLSDVPMTAPTLEIRVLNPENPGLSTVRLVLPVTVLVVGVRGGAFLPEAFLPTAAIEELGLVAGEEAGYGEVPYIVDYDHPVTDADLEVARQLAADAPDTYVDSFGKPRLQGAEFRLAMIALALLFAVSVTGIAIALGEAESRPEQRSLLALGAEPRLRRRIAASRAAVLALLAGLLAVPAGLLPVWGLLISRESPLVVPVLEIGGALVLLPVIAVLGTWLLSRPIPEWHALRSVGAGR